MIDKSIRQYYQTGEKVKKFGYDVGQKLTKGGVEEAWQAGFGSPQEGRELRVLENRSAKMLQRKEEGKNYSERNLDIVTRAIAEAKGLDINNPNEMKNIDKPITQIQIEKSITEAPQIIPEEPEVKSPFAKVIPKTPDIISPHLEGDRTISTPRVIPKTPDVISPHLEGDKIMPTISTGEKYDDLNQSLADFIHESQKTSQWSDEATFDVPTPAIVTRDVGLGDAGIAERIAAENRAAAQAETQAAAIKAEADRQQRERDVAAARAPVSVPVPAHISGGGGQNGGQRGSPPTGTGGRNPWGRAYGGRVDKALGGRIRDI